MPPRLHPNIVHTEGVVQVKLRTQGVLCLVVKDALEAQEVSPREVRQGVGDGVL